MLNRFGLNNWQGEPMTLRRVRNIFNRCKPKTWTARQRESMRKDGFVTSRELASRFNVSPVANRHWARTGSIESRTLPCASEISHVHRAASGYASDCHREQQESNICQSRNIREAA